MSGSKSKIKGSGFELKIAKDLSTLYSASFVRCTSSGAYIGGANIFRKDKLSTNQTKSFKGDIVPPDDWKFFNAECKFYADFRFHLLLTGEQKVLDGWIEQSKTVADKSDVNIVFMKFNRIGMYVAVESHPLWKFDNQCVYNSAKHGVWHVVSYDEFFKNNSAQLRQLCVQGFT